MAMRNDVKPFDDVRVRRAMMMAINHHEIVNDYFGGKAEKFYWPVFPVPEHRLMYTPLKEMPQSVQELYEYHPDKAKQILAEAGYPNGFTTSILVSSAEEGHVDLLSIVKAYWAKVGVTLKIDVREPAVYGTMQRAFSYEHGITETAAWVWDAVKFASARVGSASNNARINDPLVQETLGKVAAAYWDWAELSRIQKAVLPEIQNRALMQFLPMPVSYNLWQPWLKDYHGETNTGYTGAIRWYAAGGFAWIDQDLKEQMTGRR